MHMLSLSRARANARARRGHARKRFPSRSCMTIWPSISSTGWLPCMSFMNRAHEATMPTRRAAATGRLANPVASTSVSGGGGGGGGGGGDTHEMSLRTTMATKQIVRTKTDRRVAFAPCCPAAAAAADAPRASRRVVERWAAPPFSSSSSSVSDPESSSLADPRRDEPRCIFGAGPPSSTPPIILALLALNNLGVMSTEKRSLWAPNAPEPGPEEPFGLACSGREVASM